MYMSLRESFPRRNPCGRYVIMRRLIALSLVAATVTRRATSAAVRNTNRKVLGILAVSAIGMSLLGTMDPSSVMSATKPPAISPPPPPGASCLSWSSPASWPELGRVPTSNDTAVIPTGRTICLNTKAAKAGNLHVYGTLTKLASANVQLTMHGNLIVDQGGSVSLDSSTDGSTWLIQFIVPSESQFVGGGDVPLDSDVGFWVAGAGHVDLEGAPKTSWTRLTGTANTGSSVISVQDATGWRVGDELAIAPTEPTTVPGFYLHFDTLTITGISGTQITISPALVYTHPAVTFHNATYTAEVMNLTRTARIEGRSGYRTHFWIHNTSAPASAHMIKYVQFRYLGPFGQGAFTTDGDLSGTLGRWGGPHFHMNGDFTNGSQVIGSVVRDYGAHAFVPHDSNGITLQDDIAFDGNLTAYWYDTTDSMGMCMAGPNHLTYTHNIAAEVLAVPSGRGYRIAGFYMGTGDRSGSPASSNVAENNVAVGVQGNLSASGFIWPEVCNAGTWRFDAGNIAHDNAVDGIFTWQNDGLDHQILNFVAYYNGKAGIEQGAYQNNFLYQHVALYGNGVALRILALTTTTLAPHPLEFVNSYFDAAGAPY